MSAIDEIKQKTDIVEVIGQYTTLKKAGRNLTALCPFHSEKHPSFFVYPEQQSWHCFGACNTGGDVFSFIMKKENMDFGETLRMLAQRAGVTLPSRTEQAGKKEEKEELYRINEAASLYFNNLLLNSPAAEKARDYVAGRGFTPETIASFQLGYSMDSWEALKQYLTEKGFGESSMLDAGLLIEAENGKTHDRFRGKLMFPIRDARGRTIGFGARALDDSMPKYTNSPQSPTFDKSSTLYGIDLAAAEIRKQELAIVMEGYMDVITAHQNGVTNAIASMGTAVTETQVTALKNLRANIVLALDADAAGEEAMLRTVGYENILNTEIRVIVLPEGKDPDDIIREDVKIWQELVTQTVPVVDYTFDKVLSGLDLTTARDKSLIFEKLLPIVAEIKSVVRQAHYIQELSRITKEDIRTVESSIKQLKSPTIRRKLPSDEKSLMARALRPITSDSREEYCLTLLLQHPELRSRSEGLSPDYFEHTENREIFNALQTVGDPAALKDSLDPAIHEHLDAIAGRNLPATRNNFEQKFVDCVMGLRRKYLKSLAAKKAASGDTGADMAWLEEDIKISSQLRELDARRNKPRP